MQGSRAVYGAEDVTTADETFAKAEPRIDVRPAGSGLTGAARSLVVRNYDMTTAHVLDVRFVDPSDSVVFDRIVRLAPGETHAVRTHLDRAVYRVEVREGDRVSDSAECLVGPAPSETALVETGNGAVSVVEGPT